MMLRTPRAFDTHATLPPGAAVNSVGNAELSACSSVNGACCAKAAMENNRAGSNLMSSIVRRPRLPAVAASCGRPRHSRSLRDAAWPACELFPSLLQIFDGDQIPRAADGLFEGDQIVETDMNSGQPPSVVSTRRSQTESNGKSP